MSNEDLNWLAAQRPQRTGSDPAARDRAMLALLQHATTRPARRESKRGLLRTRNFGFGLTAVAGTAVIAAALVLSAGTEGPTRHAHGAAVAAVGQRHGASSPLVRLADDVSDAATPAGDATLVAQTLGTGASAVTVYDLFADNGKYFFSRTKAGLAAQVSADHSAGSGPFAREVAAARLAATGDVATAGQDMADADDPGKVMSKAVPKMSAAAMKAKHVPPGYVLGSLYDNYAWENSEEALIAGAGQPQVRAGVLQIIATLPGVKVTSGTSGGQATEILTSGAQEVGSGYVEQLTLNAATGIPMSFAGGTPGRLQGRTTYRISRMTLADASSELGSGS